MSTEKVAKEPGIGPTTPGGEESPGSGGHPKILTEKPSLADTDTKGKKETFLPGSAPAPDCLGSTVGNKTEPVKEVVA